MIKKMGLLLLCASVIAPYFFMRPVHEVSAKTPHAVQSKEKYRIAIMMPMHHPALDDIKEGFITEITQHMSVECDTFVGNGNRSLMRAQAEEIIQKEYDLVFAITTVCALLIKEVTEQRSAKIPIVFGAADDPIGNGIIASYESSKNNCTGITDYKDFEHQLGLYTLLMPTIRKIVLVYNPSPGLIKQKQALARACESRSMALSCCEIMAPAELLTKVEGQIHQFDAVLVLKDNMVVSGVESLVQLCDRFHVPLIVSDLNSVYKGAAIAFGVYEKEYGIIGAQLAQQILIEQKKPQDIAIVLMKDFKIICNAHACEKQHVKFDERVKYIMQNSEVI